MEKTKLVVNSNGSLKVEGDFEIVDMEGRTTGCRAVPWFHFADVAGRRINPFVMDRTRETLIMWPPLSTFLRKSRKNMLYGSQVLGNPAIFNTLTHIYEK